MNKKYGLGVIVLAALALLFFKKRTLTFDPDFADAKCRGCNVILISVDSLRTDHMSLYGFARKTTPNIDAWAAKAWVFENYFASSYLTPISEGSVHTGFYPEVNGLTNFRRSIHPDVPTLAEVLRAHGYATSAFGSSPEYSVYDSLRASFSRGFDSYNIAPNRRVHRLNLPWEQIRERLKQKEKPFFLWLALGDVHAPFGAWQKNLFADRAYEGPFRGLRFAANLQYYYDGYIYNMDDPAKDFRIVNWDGPDDEVHYRGPRAPVITKWPQKISDLDLKYMRDLYDNGVARADENVAELLRQVEELGLAGRTVVILQSEHGESLGEYGYIAHYDIDEATTHVPLVFASPALAKSPSGQALRTPQLLSGVDLMPSVLEHLGLSRGEKFDGQSFFDPKDGKLRAVRDEVYLTRTPLWETLLKAGGPDSPFDQLRGLDDQIAFKDHGVRDKTAKLIHRTARLAEEQYSCWTFVSGKRISRKEYEFYDLVRDPLGKNPLDPPVDHPLIKKLADFESAMAKRAKKTPTDAKVEDYQ